VQVVCESLDRHVGDGQEPTERDTELGRQLFLVLHLQLLLTGRQECPHWVVHCWKENTRGQSAFALAAYILSVPTSDVKHNMRRAKQNTHPDPTLAPYSADHILLCSGPATRGCFSVRRQSTVGLQLKGYVHQAAHRS